MFIVHSDFSIYITILLQPIVLTHQLIHIHLLHAIHPHITNIVFLVHYCYHSAYFLTPFSLIILASKPNVGKSNIPPILTLI